MVCSPDTAVVGSGAPMPHGAPMRGWLLVAWVAVLLLVLYLTLTGAGAPNGVYLTPFRVATEALLIVVLGAWAIVALPLASARPRSTIAPALAAPILALLVSTAASAQPRLGIEFVGWAFVAGSLYMLLVLIVREPALARRMVIVVAAVTATLSIAYIVSAAIAWLDWWSLVGRLAVPPLRPAYEALTFGAPGILTAFLSLGAGFAIAGLGLMGRRAVLAAGLLASLAGTAILLAAARSGWFALLIAIVVTAAVATATGSRPRLPQKRRTRAAFLAVTIIAGGVVIALAPAILRRALSGGGEELRSSLAASAARIFTEHPLFGTGPGTWVGLRAAHTLEGEVDYYIPHAHNVPLQTLAETGLAGALAALILFLAVGRLVWRGLRAADPERRAMALAATFGTTYLATHQLFDAFMDAPAVLFAAVLPIAILDAAATRLRDRDRGSTPGRRSLLVPAVALLAVALILFRLDLPALDSERAVDAASKGDWVTAGTALDPSLRDDASLLTYRYLDGLISAALRDEPRAAAAFEVVARTDDLPQAWLNLAAIRLRQGDQAGASNAIDAAMRLGVQQPAVALPAAILWLEIGEEAEAISAIAAALRVAPSLADDPFWEGESRRQAALAVAIERILAEPDPRVAMSIAIYSGDLDAARGVVDALSVDLRMGAGLAVDAWAGDATARADLEALATASPLASWNVVWAARVAAHHGDLAAARRFSRWAAIVSGVPGSNVGEDVRVVDEPRERAQVPGPNANFHFRYAYRRSMPWDMLIADLPKLSVVLD